MTEQNRTGQNQEQNRTKNRTKNRSKNQKNLEKTKERKKRQKELTAKNYRKQKNKEIRHRSENKETKRKKERKKERQEIGLYFVLIQTKVTLGPIKMSMNLKTPPLKDQLQREVSDKGRKQKQRKKEKKTQKLGPGPNFTTRSSTGHSLSLHKRSVHLEHKSLPRFGNSKSISLHWVTRRMELCLRTFQFRSPLSTGFSQNNKN